MDYIEKMLGEPVTRQSWKGLHKMPYYLHDAYRFEQVTIGTQKCLMIAPQGELGTISAIKRNIKRIQSEWNYPVVLELHNLSRQRKETFIKEKIPFVVHEKQLYMPFMGVALQEKYDKSKNLDVEKLSPSAQVLLFLFIYEKNKPLYLSTVPNRLGFKPMRATRAAVQLVEIGLLDTHKDGVQKVLTSTLAPKELFETAKPYLLNPVRRKIYIYKKDLKSDYFLAGESALSEKSMLNSPRVNVFGTVKIPKGILEMQLLDSETQCELELWRYDPTVLTGDKCVDTLSLLLTLGKLLDDPRVEMSIDELLDELWKDEI